MGTVGEARERLEDARRQKSDVEADLREGYFLTRPRLSRQVLSKSKPESPPKDADALATALGGEVVEDFATEIINGFMPPHFDWAGSDRGEGVRDADWNAVKDAAGEMDREIFRGIRASNFDAELATMLIPDAGLGTVAMMIEDEVAHEPILCQHVPIRELEINIGPRPGVDDRFLVRWVRARRVQSVFPGRKLPPSLVEKAEKKPEEWVECVWAYWRDWSKATDVVWDYTVFADNELIDAGEYRGEGSCPLIVGRWAPDTLHAFGNGATLDALPYLRIHDVLAEATQDAAPLNVRPPIAFPDDGVMDFSDGIEDGKAYPKRPGSKGEIEPLYPTGRINLDFGVFTLNDIEKLIRRKHFADYPEQAGKTPPTATQWLDEMVKSQRRLGTPGQKFWREFPAEVFLRFKFLLEKRGVIRPLARDGRAVATRPRNPATKAQENQEVQVATQLLGAAKTFFPMTANAAIDEYDTIKAIQEKLGDRLVKLRDKEQVTQLVQGILQNVQGAAGGGGQGGGQPQ